MIFIPSVQALQWIWLKLYELLIFAQVCSIDLLYYQVVHTITILNTLK